jgi:hypothetical protein
MFFLVTYIVSILALAFLIGHRMYAERRKVSLFSEHTIQRLDTFFHDVYVRVAHALVTFAHQAVLFVLYMRKNAAAQFLQFLHRAHDWVERKIEHMKGRNARKHSGSVSFFLKTVAEYKEQLQQEKGGDQHSHGTAR